MGDVPTFSPTDLTPFTNRQLRDLLEEDYTWPPVFTTMPNNSMFEGVIDKHVRELTEERDKWKRLALFLLNQALKESGENPFKS